GCDANSQNMGIACGGVQYGVRVAKVDGESTCLTSDLSNPVAVKKDDMYGYGWSDTVGWINFCGAHSPLFNPPPVTFTASLAYDSSSPTVYSNGEDYYRIIVKVQKDADPVLGAQPNNVSVQAVDFSDSLKADQINNAGDGAA